MAISLSIHLLFISPLTRVKRFARSTDENINVEKSRYIYIYFFPLKIFFKTLSRIKQNYSFHWINRLYKQIYNRLNSTHTHIYRYALRGVPSITNSWTRNNFIYVVFPQQPRAIVAPAARGKEFSLSDYDRIGEVVLRFNDAARFQQSLTGATRCGDTAKNGWKNPRPIRSNDSGDID